MPSPSLGGDPQEAWCPTAIGGKANIAQTCACLLLTPPYGDLNFCHRLGSTIFLFRRRSTSFLKAFKPSRGKKWQWFGEQSQDSSACSPLNQTVPGPSPLNPAVFGRWVGGPMRKFFKMSIILLAGIAFVVATLADADARNRKGSKRTYSGHGKGSYYVGGK
jgi:hypothetical protein